MYRINNQLGLPTEIVFNTHYETLTYLETHPGFTYSMDGVSDAADEDDEWGERQFMLAESRNRELTEDECIIYSIY